MAVKNNVKKERMVATDAGWSPRGVKVSIRETRAASKELNKTDIKILPRELRSLLDGKRETIRRYPGARKTRTSPKSTPNSRIDWGVR
jgi:hypothetical protein